MTIIPDFYSLNRQQKPAGTYDLYASCEGVSTGSWPTYAGASVTVTICQCGQHPRVKSKTRVHRTNSIMKAKVECGPHHRQVEILEAVVECLNKGEIHDSELPRSVDGFKAYSELTMLVVKRSEY